MKKRLLGRILLGDARPSLRGRRLHRDTQGRVRGQRRGARASAARCLERPIEGLLPSHGRPVTDRGAINALRERLRKLSSGLTHRTRLILSMKLSEAAEIVPV